MKWRVSVGLRPGSVVESISQRYLPAMPSSMRSVASPTMAAPPLALKFCFPDQLPCMKESLASASAGWVAGCWARVRVLLTARRAQTRIFIKTSRPTDDITSGMPRAGHRFRVAARYPLLRRWGDEQCAYGAETALLTKHALEYRVDVAELARVVERLRELFRTEQRGDGGIAGDFIAEDDILFPRAHGVRLHEAVGVFAEHAGLDEIDQELAGEDEAAGGLEIALHALGVDEQAVDQVGGFGEQVVGEDGRVREDDALDGGVGDVALVPEGDVFERGLRVAAKDAGEAADLLRCDRVLFVGHDRGALLVFAEILLCLADLGALQVANFDGDFVERAAEDGERGDVGRVAVSLDDLGGDGRGLEAQARADFFFLFWTDVRESANGAGELADAHVLGSGVKAREVALHLGEPVEQLEAEGGGLGVHAVSAADGGRVLELERAALEDGEECFDAGTKHRGCFSYLQCLRGVDNVVGGEAVVQPSGFGGQALRFEGFGDGGGEGDNVVLHFGLDLADAVNRESGAGDGCGSVGGDDAVFGEDSAGRGFDLEPAAVFALLGPDEAHGRAGVAIDQETAPGC